MFRGSIVALITPFRNGAVDEKTLRDLIDWHVDQGTSGIVPVGTTGESPTLSHDEHKQVVDITVDAVAGRLPVIAGAGSNSTMEAIDFTDHAKKAGADAALVVTPYYNKPTQAGLYAHYKAIVDAVDLPVIIYNIPGRSIIDMSVETMAKLAEHPNIVGVKDSTADLTRPVLTTEACGQDFCQLTGEDASTLAFLAHGGGGAISVTANVAPRLCADMHEAWAHGDAKEALSIHTRLMPLHRNLFIEASPAPAKYALSRLGKASAELRLPLVECSEAAKQAVDQAMTSAGLIN
ncbi:MAG: 4-hydroxy-tetrahydrodipicolinate synthase [Geminicoccaceae bacterium]